MATQSPFSMLEGLFQNFNLPVTPPAWAVEEGHRRIVLLLNHVLQQEPQAMERLMRQKGRVVLSQWRHFSFKVVVTPAGLLDLATQDATSDLTLVITEESPFAIAQAVLQGNKPSVRIEGDVQLAAEINWLADNVRWDVEEDLARILGDAPAHMLGANRQDGSPGHSAICGQAPCRMTRLYRGFFIVWVVLRYGLDELVLSGFQQPWLKGLTRVLTLGRNLSAPRGQRLREALERLGPIFVKFGQVLSTRRDLLPLDIADELAKLQDRVPPFASEVAVSTIERALRKPIADIFVSFERTPVASASIAQVHFAVLRDRKGVEREVAVKVLRPGMLSVIDKDLSLMRMMAGWLEGLSTDGKRLKPREVVAEFDKYLHDELDLVREASCAAQLRRNMEGLNLVLIPEMLWDLCSTEVLVMERMNGVPINQVARLRAAGVDFPKLARDGVTLFFTQVFRDGFFHADMHPGNIQVSLDPQTFGRYISLDFGIVGTLTEVDKEYLAQNFVAFFRRDYKRVAELHIESGWVPAATRVDELEAAVRAVCEPYFDRPLKEISLGMVLMRLFQTSRRFQVEIQPQLVLLQKTLLNIEGLGRDLDPDLDLWATAKPFLEQWMLQQVGPQKLIRELKAQAPRYAKLLPELPALLHSYLQRNAVDNTRLVQELLVEQKRTNRLLQTLVAAVIGFALGMVVMQIMVRVRLF